MQLVTADNKTCTNLIVGYDKETGEEMGTSKFCSLQTDSN
jgi:hypothetical protein